MVTSSHRRQVEIWQIFTWLLHHCWIFLLHNTTVHISSHFQHHGHFSLLRRGKPLIGCTHWATGENHSHLLSLGLSVYIILYPVPLLRSPNWKYRWTCLYNYHPHSSSQRRSCMDGEKWLWTLLSSPRYNDKPISREGEIIHYLYL